MIWNQIKSTFRFFIKHRLYSIINILGLAIGISSCIFIYMYVNHELSYDKQFNDHENIYRVESYTMYQGEESHWAAILGNIMFEVSRRYPDVEAGTRIIKSHNIVVLHHDDKTFREEKFCFVDSSFFDVFSMKAVHGNLDLALSSPNNIILTESTAKKIFGNEDATGKVLKSEMANHRVAAVIEDFPENTHFHFNMAVPISFVRSLSPNVDKPGPSAFYTYIKVHEQTRIADLDKKIQKDVYEMQGYDNSVDSLQVPEGYEAKYLLMPITDIHLKGHAEKEFESNSDIKYVLIFSLIAVFILLLACVNYINLSTARSADRSREVGIRKVLGASSCSIFRLFITEAFLITFISVIVAMCIVELLMPEFNNLTGLKLNFNLTQHPSLILSILVIYLITSLISGFFPALFLSRFHLIRILKPGTVSHNGQKSSLYFRRSLVIFQFAVTIFLIISTMTVYKQFKFIHNKELGFNKDNIVVLSIPRSRDHENFDQLKNEMEKIPQVENTSLSASIPGERIPFLSVRFPELVRQNPDDFEGTDDIFAMRTFAGDEDLLRTFEIEIAEGRGFSKESGTDAKHAFLLNEAAVKHFNLDNPVGKAFHYVYNMPEPKKGKIIGVVKDFHYASLHNKVEPLMIHIHELYTRYLNIRISGDREQALSKIESRWSALYPQIPMEYFFLDTFYDSMHLPEKRMVSIITIFTIIAIFIACLGLFGLVSFITRQRTKEIGIRKVLGGSVYNITSLICREFIILVLLANIFAWLPAWYYMKNWLENFAYRTEIGVAVFVLSIIASLVIALLTVTFNTYKAAQTNPINALRYE